ncbi:PulJ/GspJ family protein [Engelhardtia mirabilis]|uniref:Prepilin-type N-terminal cleavage/methylation domain-containing protein n=1 Tax=Engelhardtia mirabilis TaxID=2528011 RepID=A0A518BSN9_9BACT|nr:hypothetical protein Pla133_51130 [Planctomycetes bacterium Pla133]QDV04315.1 hypothetical protein Pla86_51100 [Planctomycetes bacterium Pla86]
MRPAGARSRRGFTLIEISITLTLFGSIVGAFLLATTRSRSLTDTQSIRLDLEAEVLDVVRNLRRELGRSGYATVDGQDFPLIFDPGQSVLVDFQHDDPQALSEVDPTELAYLVASDADGDDWPDLDADNAVQWSDERRALLLVPNAQGFNDLVLRSTEAADRILSRRALYLRCETTSDTGFEIPLRGVRVQFVLGRQEPNGRELTRTSTEVFVLANGGLGV